MGENGGGCWARNMGIETDLMIQPVPSLVQQGEWRAVGPHSLGEKLQRVLRETFPGNTPFWFY